VFDAEEFTLAIFTIVINIKESSRGLCYASDFRKGSEMESDLLLGMCSNIVSMIASYFL
jgi:hypothetical protein